ncbi:MAG: hypothetical protein K2X29_04680 [Candidatus Obscuribacterales bacterium]|nr:hypothetical protein [Candidatus Obscuribacterales bacterium]
MGTGDSKYWTRVIKEARKHPQGVEGYVAEHGISRPVYYQWFRKLKPQHPEWKKPLGLAGRKIPRRKKMFVPINIEPGKTIGSSSAVEIRLAGGHTIAFPDGMDEKSLIAIVRAMGNGTIYGGALA